MTAGGILWLVPMPPIWGRGDVAERANAFALCALWGGWLA